MSSWRSLPIVWESVQPVVPPKVCDKPNALVQALSAPILLESPPPAGQSGEPGQSARGAGTPPPPVNFNWQRRNIPSVTSRGGPILIIEVSLASRYGEHPWAIKGAIYVVNSIFAARPSPTSTKLAWAQSKTCPRAPQTNTMFQVPGAKRSVSRAAAAATASNHQSIS